MLSKTLFLIFHRFFSFRQTCPNTKKVEINNKINHNTYNTVFPDIFVLSFELRRNPKIYVKHIRITALIYLTFPKLQCFTG
jgi:hypothetical protein